MSYQPEVNGEILNFKVRDSVDRFLAHMIKQGGSDLHVKATANIFARINGDITKLSNDIFTKRQAITLAKELLIGRFNEFVEKKELDFVYVMKDKMAVDEAHSEVRFRVNIFFQLEGVSAVFRVIPAEVKSLGECNLPSVLNKFVDVDRGLVLVTGITGSGKSTTLAALLNDINRNRRKHIITIEDPIEFVHKDINCIINQRSVGQDTISFASALKAALREDPDIILVGEMRDVETIEIALHAANTGHLVLSTLHTTDAVDTVNRIISTFDKDEQPRIRETLASVLKGIISQRLVPTKKGGRVAAVEVMVQTSFIEKLILENRDFEILDAIKDGKDRVGSQTFDQALVGLYQQRVISKQEAIHAATSESDIKLAMQGLSDSVTSDNSAIHDGLAGYNSSDVFELDEE
jgi:twitching motility protein PilT